MNTQQIHEWASARTMRSAVIGLEVLSAVRDRFDRLRADGLLDPKFFKDNLSELNYLDGCGINEPRSLILLASPRPAHIVTFRLRETVLRTILPPTYVDYRPFFERVREVFLSDLEVSAFNVNLLNAPLKSLAAAAGLIRYGRNNIGYVPGWGSYFQLVGLVTDYPLASDPGPRRIEDQVLDACRDCELCRRACPTAAISERFLLRAERCYTLFSESLEWDTPVPPLPRQNCLAGCLKCQTVCPENRGLLKRENTGLIFTQAETEAMLHDPDELESGLWQEIRSKLAALGLSFDAKLLARNFRVLIKRK